MSENVTDPSKVDETKLDGYKKLGAAALGIIGSTVLLAVKDPAAQEATKAAIEMAASLVPAAISGIYLIIQGMIDINKVKGTAQVETAKNTPAPTTAYVPTATDAMPQGSQIAAFNKGIETYQAKPDFPNVVSQNLDVWTKLAKTDEGAFQILMDRIGVVIDEEYRKWADASLQSVEALQKFASQYFGVKLTQQDCEAISANKNLATVIHAESDKTIIASIYTAHKAGTLGKGVWEGCVERALYFARKSVIDTVQRKLISDDMSIVKEGMSDLGLNSYTQRTAISGQGTWYINLGGSPKIINPAVLAGLDPETYKPI